MPEIVQAHTVTTGVRAHVEMDDSALLVAKFIAAHMQVPMQSLTGREVLHFAKAHATNAKKMVTIVYMQINVAMGLNVGQGERLYVVTKAQSPCLSWKSW